MVEGNGDRRSRLTRRRRRGHLTTYDEFRHRSVVPACDMHWRELGTVEGYVEIRIHVHHRWERRVWRHREVVGTVTSADSDEEAGQRHSELETSTVDGTYPDSSLVADMIREETGSLRAQIPRR